MNRLSRLVALSASAITLAALSTGCSTTKQTEGTTQSSTVAWTSGTNIYVDIHGGTIRVADAATALSVTQGTDPNNATVNFTPFVSNADNSMSGADAQTEFMNNLVLTANPQGTADSSRFGGAGTGLIVEVAETGTHQTSLSARVDLTLPANFNGALYVHTDSGDVIIKGAVTGYTNVLVENEGKIDFTYTGGGVAPTSTGFAAKTANGDIIASGTQGSVTASTGLGDVEIDVGAATAGTETGDISSDQGDVTLNVPTASVMYVEATSSNDVVYPNPLPATWTDQVAASNSISLTGNGGSNVWKVNATDGTSNIQIN